MATLGDPVTDLALMVAYQRLAALPAGASVIDVSRAPGFLTQDETVQRYVERSGQEPTHFAFCLGLAYFKLAAIFEGIHFRYLQGATVGEGFDGIGQITEPLIDAGLTALATDKEGR